MDDIKFLVDDLVLSNLCIVTNDGARYGRKNMLGIRVKKNDKNYFYSIIDDCIFRSFEDERFSELLHSSRLLPDTLYACVFSDFKDTYIADFNQGTFKDGDLLSKNDIIKLAIKSWFYSDYDLVSETMKCNPYDNQNIEHFLISNENQYCLQKGLKWTGQRFEKIAI